MRKLIALNSSNSEHPFNSPERLREIGLEHIIVFEYIVGKSGSLDFCDKIEAVIHEPWSYYAELFPGGMRFIAGFTTLTDATMAKFVL